MSRANPFGDLDDFAPDAARNPAPAAAIDRIAESASLRIPNARSGTTSEAGESAIAGPPTPPARVPRRRTTGRNRQINIKARCSD